MMTIRRKQLGRELSTETETAEAEAGGVLKDGQSIRVPMLMMDGSPNPALDATQRAVAKDAHTSKLLVDDGTGNSLNLHKPGFRYSTNAAERTAADAALVEAYEARDLADREAWKTDDDHPLKELLPRVTTPNPNRLTNARGQQHDAHTDDRALAYAEYDREAENAWRT